MKFNWGHGIFIFMTIFVILSIIFIIFSLNQSQDLVSDDYYDKGADYSQQIETNKRSVVYQDSISVNLNISSIDIDLCQSLKVSGDTILLHFYRPSDKNSDIKLKFPMSEIISIPFNNFKNGRYEIKISWNNADSLYNIKKDIIIK
jgi:hypothetical protein